MKIVTGGSTTVAAALSWLSRFMKRLGGQDDSSTNDDSFDSSLIGSVWQSKDAAQAFDQGELKSLEREGTSTRLSICFRNLTPNTILYSWISPSGQFRGFRPLKPSEIVTGPVTQGEHVEQSYLGHAFVFCEMPEDEDGEESDKESGACKKMEWWRHADVENLDKLHVIGAYRASSLKPESKEGKAQKEKDEKKANGTDDDKKAPALEQKDTETDNSDDSDSDDDDEPLDYLFCHVVSIEPRKPTIFDCCCLPESSSSGSTTSHLRHSKKRHTQRGSSSSSTSSSGNLYTVSACVQPMAKVTLIDTCQTKRYAECKLGDDCYNWPVRLEQAWPLNGDKELYQLLRDDLSYALSCIPEHARAQLRQKQTLLWINKTFSYGPASNPIPLRNLCFHPAARWLVRNKMHKQKAGCVELYNTEQYCKDRNNWGPGGIFIHEFSHAYHYKCLPNGYDNKEIQECYEAAMKEGLYDCIEFHSSSAQENGEKKSTGRAYACENCMEYWAELSTAFLGGTLSWRNQSKQEEFNKWFPFNRVQLKKHDPRAYQLLQKLWTVQDNDDDDEQDK